VYFVHHFHKVPASSALASVTLDKILELLANIVFLLVGIFVALRLGYQTGSASIRAMVILAIVFSLLAAYTLALWTGRAPIHRLAHRVSPRSPKLVSALRAIASAETQISRFCQDQPMGVLVASLLSVVIWAAMVGEFWFIVKILGLNLGLFQVITAMTAARVAFLFPLPGGLGALEASQVIAMNTMGIDPAIGLSIALLIRARDILVAGAGILWGGVLSHKKSSEIHPLPVEGGTAL
jgi:uncharacterized protein (TIRG00374 family)